MPEMKFTVNLDFTRAKRQMAAFLKNEGGGSGSNGKSKTNDLLGDLIKVVAPIAILTQIKPVMDAIKLGISFIGFGILKFLKLFNLLPKIKEGPSVNTSNSQATIDKFLDPAKQINEDWFSKIPPLTWDTFVNPMKWPDYLRSLIWPDYVKPLDWSKYVSPIQIKQSKTLREGLGKGAGMGGIDFHTTSDSWLDNLFLPNIKDGFISKNGKLTKIDDNDSVFATKNPGGMGGGTKIFNFYGVTSQEMINTIKSELADDPLRYGRI